MTKYEEFKNRKILTLGELINRLKDFPQDATLLSRGGDIGGYDVSSANYIDILYNKERNIIIFSHMECEMYKAVEKKLITHKQFEELNDETDED